MSIVRVKFIRGEEVKYISHLDLMKVFERTTRRAGIPIAYSQGFNPHAHMVFGLPLSVGVTSETEYSDFELSMSVEPDEIMKLFNSNAPEGFRLVEAKVLRNKSNIMAEIVKASYDVLVVSENTMDIVDLESNFNKLLSQESILVMKEGKKGTKEVNIKPMIFNINSNTIKKISDDNSWVEKYHNALVEFTDKVYGFDVNNSFCVSMDLNAGSVANLKPELVIKGYNKLFNDNLKVVKIHRTSLFIKKEGKIIEPLSEIALN